MTDSPWSFGLNDALAQLPDSPDTFRFHYGLRHGSMKIGVYAPKETDAQSPHPQDELYIVISGSGDFVRGEERIRFAPQDVLFVPAGLPHRFEHFSDDFSTWVIFWGAAGGER